MQNSHTYSHVFSFLNIKFSTVVVSFLYYFSGSECFSHCAVHVEIWHLCDLLTSMLISGHWAQNKFLWLFSSPWLSCQVNEFSWFISNIYLKLDWKHLAKFQLFQSPGFSSWIYHGLGWMWCTLSCLLKVRRSMCISCLHSVGVFLLKQRAV